MGVEGAFGVSSWYLKFSSGATPLGEDGVEVVVVVDYRGCGDGCS